MRLAVGDLPSEIRVSWLTASQDCPTAATYGPAFTPGGAGGKWGLLGDSAGTRRVTGTKRVYGPGDMCESPAKDADFPPSVTHTATFTGLEPGALYYYT